MSKVYEQGMGYYEKRLCILMFLSAIPNAFVTLQMLITQFTPNYRCDVTEVFEYFQAKNASNALDEALNSSIPWEENEVGEVVRSKCKQYNYTQLLAGYDHQNGENISIIPCKSMHFEGPESSVITEFRLICDRAWLNPFLTSSMFLGMMVGCSVAGSLSDKYGRRPIFLFFTYWSFITVFLLSFVGDEIWYGILCAFVGAGNLVNFTVAAVIAFETVPPKHRAFLYFSLTIGYSFGYSLMSPISYFFRDWRWFLRFSGATGILYIPYIWLIDETPRWLIISGKYEEAQKILNKIAKMNHHPALNVKDLKELLPEVPLGVWETFVQICRKPVLVCRFVIECFTWMVIALSYFALTLNNNNLGGNRFLNLFFGSIADIASVFVYYMAISKWGRCFSYIATSCVLACSIVGTYLVTNWGTAFVIILTMTGKLMAGAAWAIIYVHMPEMFPTKTRQSIFFWAVVFSRFGGVVAPFVIYAGESGNTLTPSLITSGLLLVTSLLSLFLAETSNIALPQTVEEAASLEGIWKQYQKKLMCCDEKAQCENSSNEYELARSAEDAT